MNNSTLSLDLFVETSKTFSDWSISLAEVKLGLYFGASYLGLPTRKRDIVTWEFVIRRLETLTSTILSPRWT